MANTRTDDYIIDLGKMWNIFRRNFLKIMAVVLIFGLAAYAGTSFLIEKTYKATASVIIVSNEDSTQGVTYSDVQLSQKLTSTYSRILTSETVGEKVIKNLGLDKEGWTAETYKSAVNVSSSSNTEVLDVSVTTKDPETSAKVANEAVNVFSNQVYDIMNVRNVTVLDKAKIPVKPSGPNVVRNTMLGVALGILLGAVYVVIASFADTKVKTEAEVKEVLGYPVIGLIPEMLYKEAGAYAED